MSLSGLSNCPLALATRWKGAKIAPDARGRLQEFLDYLEKNDVVVAYNADYEQYGLASPFDFVPRDPKIDAPDDIMRRGESPILAEGA